MGHQPKVSIILPSLNVASYIRECLESVTRQTLKDIEIICVDSGSTDGTLEVIREFEAKDPRVKVIVSDKKSYGRQMNLGFDAATGEYLGIVETDDWVVPNMYEKLYRIAKRNQLDFVKADFYRFTVNPDGSLDKTYNQLARDKSFYGRVLVPGDEPETFKFIMNTWSGIYDMEFLRRWNIRHNETPGASYQDNGFWFQTFCRAQRAMFINTPFYMNRRDNPNSSVYSTSKVYCMRDEYDYIRSIINSDISNLSKYIPLCNFFRFCGYYYNTIKRISPELRKEFIFYISKEFRAIADANELDRSLFSNGEWNELQQIMYYPEQYYAKNIQDSKVPHINESSYKYSTNCDEKSISVVVPVYNVEKYLPECLDSILSQTFSDFEVLCVDDGSTDSSTAILEEYSKRDERIRVLRKENGGLSSARNYGLSQSTGRYICFVDSDDGLAKNALEILFCTAEKKHSDVVVFGYKTTHYPLDGPVPGYLNGKNPIRNVTFPNFSAPILFSEPGAKPFAVRDFVRRSFLVKNDLWFWEECRFGEDTVFQFEMFPKAKNITFIKNKLYYYRCVRQGSLMANQNSNNEKAKHHTYIISHLAKVWQNEKLLPALTTEFSEWAIDFFYDAFIKCDNDAKINSAKEFIPVLRTFLNLSQQRKIGPGRQERIEEISSYRDLIVEQESAGEETSAEQVFTPSDEVCPRISFVVPVHNTEEYLDETLNSLMGQSMRDIEVICVDDASTDGSLAILKKYAQRDKRLVIIEYKENKTANQARKDAVLRARGEYILFCDADDTYDTTACEKLYAEMKSRPVDILQYGINVVCNDAFEEDRQWIEANAVPFYGVLKGKDVFEGCFRGKLYSFSLWNKMIDAKLAKKAFANIEDGFFPRGQDMYAFALMAYFADSYRGISGARYYNYHLGRGMDGTKRLSIDKFESFCALSKVADALKRFLINEKAFDEYADVWMSIRSSLIGDSINKWFKKVSNNDKSAAFDKILKYWPSWLVVEGVARRYWNHPEQAIQAIKNSTLYSVQKSSIKCVGMYYHNLVGGGVEKVMQLLAPIWQSLGYRVVIITDIQGPDDFLSLPEGIKRCTIPNEGVGKPFAYVNRAKALNDIVTSEEIDVLVYHAWNTGLLSWDMLTVKSAGAAFIVHAHSVFSMRMMMGQGYFSALPRIISFADGLICLSKVDECFWKKFNENTHVVLNPIEGQLFDIEPSRLESTDVLWVGRLASEKKPYEAITIFEKVHQELPDARLLMVGKAPTEQEQANLELHAERLGIKDNVVFCGFQSDVTPFYREASVFLSTSEFEGFPMAITEALGSGLPVVMYELPYLTVVQGNDAIISVPQGDIEVAAEEVVSLLTDEHRRLIMGRTAVRYIEDLSKYNYKSVWTNIFDSIRSSRMRAELPYPESVMWSTLLDSYSIGIDRIERRIKKTGGYANTTDDANLIRMSASYKIGRFATWPARKLRTLISCIKEHGMRYTLDVYLHRGA